MANYRGTLPHTPIVVDNFQRVRRRLPNSRARELFFLTHFHADHYLGLANGFDGTALYCTPQTRLFILNKFQHINPELLVPLELNISHSIALDFDETVFVTVTPLPAEHCPGACMFLFEGYFGRYLHTGDFRFSTEMRAALTPHLPKLQQIDRLFLDTTFCDPIWKMPPRQSAVSQIIDIIKKHPPTHKVYIECDMLGYEPLIEGVSKAFGKPLYVETEAKYKDLSCIPTLHNHITRDTSITRFIIARNKTFARLQDSLPMTTATHLTADIREVVYIKPSTQWFGMQGHGEYAPWRYVNKPCHANGVWHVLYSCHSSFRELIDFVAMVRPRAITPITAVDPHQLATHFGHLLDTTPTLQEVQIPRQLRAALQRSESGEDISGSEEEVSAEKGKAHGSVSEHETGKVEITVDLWKTRNFVYCTRPSLNRVPSASLSSPESSKESEEAIDIEQLLLGESTAKRDRSVATTPSLAGFCRAVAILLDDAQAGESSTSVERALPPNGSPLKTESARNCRKRTYSAAFYNTAANIGDVSPPSSPTVKRCKAEK